MKLSIVITILSILTINAKGEHPTVQNFRVNKIGYNVVQLTWEAPNIASNIAFQEDFESGIVPSTWTLADVDEDGENWEIHPTAWSSAHSGNFSIASYSWFNGNILTPNNWLISPEIEIPENAILEYWISGVSQTYSHEHYQIRISTGGSSINDFTEIIVDEILPENNNSWHQRNFSLTNFAGSSIRIAIVHNNSSNVFALKIDDISIKSYNHKEIPDLIGYSIFRKTANATEFNLLYTAEPQTTEFIDTLEIEGRTSYYIKANYSDGEQSNNSEIHQIQYIDWYPAVENIDGSIVNNLLTLTWDHPELITKKLIDENFENPRNLSEWLLTDYDNDNEKWEIHTATAAYEGNQSMASYSWFNGTVLNPNNWAISAILPLTGGTKVMLSWFTATISANYPNEHYQIRIGDHTVNDTTNYSVLFEESLSAGDTIWKRNSIDISNYLHDTVKIAFVHNNSTNQFALKIDSVGLKSYNKIISYKIFISNYESDNYYLHEEINASDFINTGYYNANIATTNDVWIKIIPTYADGGVSPHNKPFRIPFISTTNNIEIDTFKIYPNPAGDIVYIDNGQQINTKNLIVSVIDFNGIEQIKLITTQQKTQLNTSNLKSGIYTIRLIAYNKVVIHKIVIL